MINNNKKYFNIILFSFIIQLILLCIVNPNYSKAITDIDYSNEIAIIPSFTSYEDFVNKFLQAAENVYHIAHEHWHYEDSSSIPPCADGKITCERLICRALWDIGFTDQKSGGFPVKGGVPGEYLLTHGFEFHEGQYDIQPGDIVRVNGGRESGDYGHTFLIVEYDPETQICKKFDMGHESRIRMAQPFTAQLVEQGWIDRGRTYDGYYRWKGGSSSKGALQSIKSVIDIETGKPEKYDIMIDENKIDSENGLEIPITQTSIDSILYNNDFTSNIDFFETNSFENKVELKSTDTDAKDEEQKKWEDLKTYVRIIYRVLLYIALALMITSIILIGILLVIETLSSNKINSFVEKNLKNGKSVKQNIQEKRLIEQWVYTMITLILIILVINMSISMTAGISNLSISQNENVLDSVVVYAKLNNSFRGSMSDGIAVKKDIDENTLDKNGNNLVERIKPSLHNNNINNLVDIDGTRLYLSYLEIPYYDLNGQVQIGEMIVHKDLADEVLLIFQELYNIQYPIERMELVDNYTNKTNGKEADDWTSIQANNTSAFNYRKANDGQRDLDNLSNHAYGKCIDINPLVNPYIINYYNNSEKPYTTHVPEDGPNGTNEAVNYNDKFIKRNEMTGWTEIEKKERIAKDTEIYRIFTKYGWTWLEYAGGNNYDLDSQHFQKLDASNAKAINWNSLNNSNTSSNGNGGLIYNFDKNTNSNSIKEVYFTTNFEGLYMMLSNYDWNNNSGHNIIYLVCGLVLTVFKIVLHYLLYFRMLIIAIMIAVVPAIIIVDEIMKFMGNRGILKKWCAIYLKLLLLRPILQITYTILGKVNVRSVEDNPFYIMIVVAILSIICVFYIKNIIANIKKKDD